MLLPVLTAYEKEHLSERQALPERYLNLSDEEMDRRIAAAKQKLGRRLVILGHHYQRDEVIKFADYTGDSYKLAGQVSQHPDADFIVFCGVHFMAESADVLSADNQQVILPDLAAGCSMADMADPEQLEQGWTDLGQMLGNGSGGATLQPRDVIPVTYINSSAAIKAFVGEHGGAVCTSSNCRNVLEWALRGGASQPSAPSTQRSKVKILFFPDQHLGRNTAYSMGYPLDRMVVWDPREDLGGNDETALRNADFVLWKGHCSVHQLFRPEHIDQVRNRFPDVKVMVHPECRFEVVEKADLAGSTAYIVDQVRKAPPGTTWAIGTEVHLINRLKREHPEQNIMVLSDCQCLCTTMFRIDLPHLCWVLENLLEGRVVNEIRVDDHTRKWATVALERMLAIKGTGNPIGKQQPTASASVVD